MNRPKGQRKGSLVAIKSHCVYMPDLGAMGLLECGYSQFEFIMSVVDAILRGASKLGWLMFGRKRHHGSEDEKGGIQFSLSYQL